MATKVATPLVYFNTSISFVALQYSGKEMCRERLPGGEYIGDHNNCPAPTDYELCKNAKYIALEQVNGLLVANQLNFLGPSYVFGLY